MITNFAWTVTAEWYLISDCVQCVCSVCKDKLQFESAHFIYAISGLKSANYELHPEKHKNQQRSERKKESVNKTIITVLFIRSVMIIMNTHLGIWIFRIIVKKKKNEHPHWVCLSLDEWNFSMCLRSISLLKLILISIYVCFYTCIRFQWIYTYTWQHCRVSYATFIRLNKKKSFSEYKIKWEEKKPHLRAHTHTHVDGYECIFYFYYIVRMFNA